LLVHGQRLYAVGGHDGRLYEFELATGQLLSTKEAPNAAYNPKQFYRRFIGTDQHGERLLLFDGNSIRAYR
jgi:hypothetical protein